jgi:hypothetical protein
MLRVPVIFSGFQINYLYAFLMEAHDSVAIKALCYKLEGHRFETR